MKLTLSPTLIFYLKFGRLLFPILALLCATLFNLAPHFLSPITQLALLGMVIVLFGLPHGALDPWIAERIGLHNTPNQIFLFTAGYLAVASLVVLSWLWFPGLSLFIFLLMSAWHFSGDWAHSINTPMRLGAGALLLLMPISFHTETVRSIFQALSGMNGGELATSLSLPPWILGAAMTLIAAMTAWKRQWATALELLSLFALAYVTPPLIYFTLYFCLLHSPRHLSGLFSSAPVDTHPRLLRMMLIYTLMSLFLMGGLWWLWSTLPFNTLILKLIFIGLAAVTVPHMLLIFAAHVKNRNI